MKGIFKEVVYDWVPADKELKSAGERGDSWPRSIRGQQ